MRVVYVMGVGEEAVCMGTYNYLGLWVVTISCTISLSRETMGLSGSKRLPHGQCVPPLQR